MNNVTLNKIQRAMFNLLLREEIPQFWKDLLTILQTFVFSLQYLCIH